MGGPGKGKILTSNRAETILTVPFGRLESQSLWIGYSITVCCCVQLLVDSGRARAVQQIWGNAQFYEWRGRNRPLGSWRQGRGDAQICQLRVSP